MPDQKRYSLARGVHEKLLVLSLVLVFASMASAQNWFKGTHDDAVVKAKSDHKLVLVDFYSYT